MIYACLSSAAAVLAIVAAVIFLRYWRDTRDRFFVIWSISLGLMAAQWALAAMLGGWETSPASYLLRLAAFFLIIMAIVDKNRRSGGGRRRNDSRVVDLGRQSRTVARTRMSPATAEVTSRTP